MDPASKRESSFKISNKSPLANWSLFSFDSSSVPIFVLDAVDSRPTQVYSFASGINKEAFILLANLGSKAAIVARRPGKEGDPYVRRSLSKDEDFDQVATVLRKIDLSDSLMAHATLASAIDLLRAGAERHFVNLGLFSNYFLRERLVQHLTQRGRKLEGESSGFFEKFAGDIPTESDGALKILNALGYEERADQSNADTFKLLANGHDLHVNCIVTKANSLDTKSESSEVVPSYEAVSALSSSNWVILTNGRLWRLYSSRVNSPSTNYFEIDLEGVSSESDPRLRYFISLFSEQSLIPKPDGSDLDSIYELGLRYAKEIEDQIRVKIFEGQLFLNLARAVLSHSSSKKYTETELDFAKATALRLLYRILFVLYAESRNLLPTNNEKYMEISIDGIRQRLNDYEKKPEERTLWSKLSNLFNSIEKGNVSANVPEYDGELFRQTEGLDDLKPANRFLVPAIRELCEWNGRGIDYQNLGVRQLGSLYEALLEYNIRQAKEDLVVYKDGTLDAAAFADLKQKPKPFVEKGEIYLVSKGVLRKGTGSYYTPDEIVRFLTSKGLEPILERRKKSFEDHIKQLNDQRKRDEKLESAIIEDLLGIKVIDPAMGSGHFLVSAVDRITAWVTDILHEHPEAPLARIIDEEREEILQTQKDKGIEIDSKLLTDAIILKRLVMKRCVYGVDINPLAVELAKLSLWLDSFTIGVPPDFP